MSLVVDASVAVEYLLRTDLGVRIAPTLESNPLLAPELADAEVLAVLRREVLAGRLDAERAGEALEDLVDWPLDRVPHAELVETAWEFRHNTSAYDALYLAVAQVHEAEVVTADGPLARAPGRGVVVHNVRA